MRLAFTWKCCAKLGWCLCAFISPPVFAFLWCRAITADSMTRRQDRAGFGAPLWPHSIGSHGGAEVLPLGGPRRRRLGARQTQIDAGRPPKKARDAAS